MSRKDYVATWSLTLGDGSTVDAWPNGLGWRLAARGERVAGIVTTPGETMAWLDAGEGRSAGLTMWRASGPKHGPVLANSPDMLDAAAKAIQHLGRAAKRGDVVRDDRSEFVPGADAGADLAEHGRADSQAFAEHATPEHRAALGLRTSPVVQLREDEPAPGAEALQRIKNRASIDADVRAAQLAEDDAVRLAEGGDTDGE